MTTQPATAIERLQAEAEKYALGEFEVRPHAGESQPGWLAVCFCFPRKAEAELYGCDQLVSHVAVSEDEMGKDNWKDVVQVRAVCARAGVMETLRNIYVHSRRMANDVRPSPKEPRD